jgi:hypothetical protein
MRGYLYIFLPNADSDPEGDQGISLNPDPYPTLYLPVHM